MVSSLFVSTYAALKSRLYPYRTKVNLGDWPGIELVCNTHSVSGKTFAGTKGKIHSVICMKHKTGAL